MMNVQQNASYYSKPVVILHWLTLVLVVGVFGAIESRELFPKGTEMREFMKAIHFSLGLTVLVVTVFRVIARFTTSTPPIYPPTGSLSRIFSGLMHVILYLLLLGMPIAGWLALSAAGKPIPFYGIEMPALVSENKVLADAIKNAHKTVGKFAYFLIAAHALAGLYHHYIKRDNTLKRMLRKNSV